MRANWILMILLMSARDFVAFKKGHFLKIAPALRALTKIKRKGVVVVKTIERFFDFINQSFANAINQTLRAFERFIWEPMKRHLFITYTCMILILIIGFMID